MADRASALDGHYKPGRYGTPDRSGVCLQLQRNLVLHQVAAWSHSMREVAEKIKESVGADASGPCGANEGDSAAALRIEPLKWWVIGGGEGIELEAEQGACLDLSHSRTHVRISGENATDLLNRLLPIDLREQKFGVGSVASSSMHHIGVTLWRSSQGYELFLPRGFALAGWEILFESATQFGLEVQ